jgi:hypothetical protein
MELPRIYTGRIGNLILHVHTLMLLSFFLGGIYTWKKQLLAKIKWSNVMFS